MPHTPSTHEPRTAGEIARGIGALLLTLTLLAGIPAALLTIAGAPPLPTAVPGLGDLVDAITTPDDGTLLITTLTWVGWLGWATFALSLAVEIPAALRGVRAPRLPALGLQQRLAAGLVAAVATLFTTSASFATTPAPAAAVHSDIQTAADADTAAAPDADAPSERVHVVERGDTLWDIAATHLGDGHRYPALYEASTDTVQPDGARLTDPDAIHVGWQITIPPDTDDDTGTQDEAATDTDPAGSHELLTDPTPEPAETTTPPPPTPDPTATAEATSTPAPNTHDRTPDPAPDDADDTSEPTAADATPTPHTARPTSGDASGPDAAGVVDAAADDTDDTGDEADSLGVCTVGGVGAVLAGGLLLYVGTLRARQRRHRPPGRRITLPTGDAARTEQELRRLADPLTLDHLNRALRTLTARYAVTGSPAPPLRYVRLIAGQLELHLAEPADPPAPFRPTTNPNLWVLDTDGHILDTEQADDYPAPYPALVTVGHDPDGGLILVDLEHTAVFTIDGGDIATAEVLAAMATELATSTWSDDVHVTVIGAAEQLAARLDHDRIHHLDGTEEAIDTVLTELSTRVDADRDALAADGAAGVGEARTARVADGTWAPEVLLIGTPLNDAQRERLADLVSTEPRVAVAAVTTHTTPVTEWATRLHTDDPERAVLDPLELTVTPQRLTAQQHDQVVDLLAAGHTDPVPASGSWQATTGSVAPVTDVDVGALDEEEPAPVPLPDGTPLVLVLGPVEIHNPPELAEPTKRAQLTALAAYLALNPGATSAAVDEAMWPGRRVSLTTRHTAMTKLRTWLGTTDDGHDYVPRATGDGYRLHPDVRTDWHLFCDLVPNGPALASTGDLRAALTLVRDQPFRGANPRRYIWAERLQQEMIAAIADVADELARRALLAGNTRLALTTVTTGLAAEPVSEALWRHRLRALHAAGDRDALEQAADQLTALADETGGELDEETLDLLTHLLDTTRARSMFRRTA